MVAATLSGNSLRQTVHTHCVSVHQAAKLVAALLRVARVTVGLAESNGLLPGLWLTSPAGWLPRTGISSGTLRSLIEYGLPYLSLEKKSKDHWIRLRQNVDYAEDKLAQSASNCVETIPASDGCRTDGHWAIEHAALYPLDMSHAVKTALDYCQPRQRTRYCNRSCPSVCFSCLVSKATDLWPWYLWTSMSHDQSSPGVKSRGHTVVTRSAWPRSSIKSISAASKEVIYSMLEGA